MTPAMLKGASTASVSATLCDAVEASDGVDVDVHEHGNSSRPADSADPDPAPEALIADRHLSLYAYCRQKKKASRRGGKDGFVA